MKYVLDHIGLGRVGRTEIHVDRGVFRDQSADQRERAVLGDGDERVVLWRADARIAAAGVWHVGDRHRSLRRLRQIWVGATE